MSTLHQFWHNITAGEQRALLWLRAFVNATAAAILQLLTLTPQDQVMAWTRREWATRIGVCLLTAFVGLLGHGEKNPAPEPKP